MSLCLNIHYKSLKLFFHVSEENFPPRQWTASAGHRPAGVWGEMLWKPGCQLSWTAEDVRSDPRRQVPPAALSAVKLHQSGFLFCFRETAESSAAAPAAQGAALIGWAAWWIVFGVWVNLSEIFRVCCCEWDSCFVCLFAHADHSTSAACSWFQTCAQAVCREPASAPRTSAWLQERSAPEATWPTHRPPGETLERLQGLAPGLWSLTACVCVSVRSVCLLLQVALPCAVFADAASQLCLKGGTNAEMAPQIDYTLKVKQHSLKVVALSSTRGKVPLR